MFVDRPDTFQDLVDEIRREGAFGFDMEFARETTYWPRLHLVQVATRSREAVIDPLALDSIRPLLDLVCDPSCLKVVHAGRQDAEIVFDSTGATPRGIFDTQIAAALLGKGEQMGYAALVRRELGVRLAKGERVTNWDRRPLSRAQMEYALNDVRHLLPLHERLSSELRREDREAWLADEQSFYEKESTYRPDPRTVYRRISGRGTLDRRQLGVLREIAAWREEEAARRDRPRNRVVPDDVLVEIARRKPDAVRDLEPLRRLHPRERERSGKAIVAAVSRAMALSEEELPPLPRKSSPDPQATHLVDILGVLLRKRAREHRIATRYLGTNADLEALVAWWREPEERPTPRLLQGWRERLVGDDLRDLYQGRMSLAIDPGTRSLVQETRDPSA